LGGASRKAIYGGLQVRQGGDDPSVKRRPPDPKLPTDAGAQSFWLKNRLHEARADSEGC